MCNFATAKPNIILKTQLSQVGEVKGVKGVKGVKDVCFSPENFPDGRKDYCL